MARVRCFDRSRSVWAVLAAVGLGCGGQAQSSSLSEAGSSAAGLGGRSASNADPGTGDSAGTVAAGGAAGSAGAAATGGRPGTPLCTGTRGASCAANDPQVCYLRTCGPEKLGFRKLYCDGGLYIEETSCLFPDDRDYSCFRIPALQHSACPSDRDVPFEGQPCVAPTCTVCAGDYVDVSGSPKVGFCTCDVVDGSSQWACGVQGTWPCPGHRGC